MLLLSTGCSSELCLLDDSCLPLLDLREHCIETSACSIDGLPSSSPGVLDIAPDETLEIPLEGIDWSDLKGRELLLGYRVVPAKEVAPDPAMARVVLDGEVGLALGPVPGPGSWAYSWPQWPSSPQLLTVSYSDGDAGRGAGLGLWFGSYGCEVVMGPERCL